MLMIAGLALTCGLGAAPATRMVCGMCEEPDRFVRLQVSTRGSGSEAITPFSHPLHLRAEQWKPILQSIQVQKRGQGILFSGPRGPVMPAFAPEEVEYLSQTLTRAFDQAQPSEWVVFGLTRVRTPEVTDITTGAWYVKGPQLYLVLGNYQEGVTMTNVRELLWQDPLHMIAAPLYDFVPGPHQSVIKEGSTLGTFLIPETLQLALAYQQLADGSPDKGSQLSVQPDMSLEEKLKRLRRMHDDGLITAEEYAAKKKLLLDGL
jgi:hypothetical protein